MANVTPPLTPSQQYITPIDTSPKSSYREQLRRRTSSFSSNHDRSPTTPRSSHRYSVSSRPSSRRFSNSSRFSNDPHTHVDDFSGGGGAGGGMGNLADELEQLGDEEYEEDVTEETVEAEGQEGKQASPVDGARDSGIDVSYTSKHSSHTNIRNFSKPLPHAQKPPDSSEKEDGEEEGAFSAELEEAMHNISRMMSYTSTTEDPLIPRTITLLQDLGNQSALEASAQRLTTSSNSLTSHLLVQTKQLQILSASLYNPLTFSAPLAAEDVDEIVPLIEALLKELPFPDPAPLQGLQKLGRETANVMHTLSSLTDTLQMSKQTTTAASRHLRTTQTIVAELRRERERGEVASEELARGDWESRLAERWAAGQCKDVLSGFHETCEALRDSLGVEEVVSAA